MEKAESVYSRCDSRNRRVVMLLSEFVESNREWKVDIDDL